MGNVVGEDANEFVSQRASFIRLFKKDIARFVRISSASEEFGKVKKTGTNQFAITSREHRDALRHFTWMYCTTKNFGAEKAWKAGDIHERLGNSSNTYFGLYRVGSGRDISNLVNPNTRITEAQLNKPANMSNGQFKKMVESIVDYQNNAIAINHAQNNRNAATPKVAAQEAAKYIQTQGLTTYKLSKDGSVATILGNQKISEGEYKAFSKRLLQLDDYANPLPSREPTTYEKEKNQRNREEAEGQRRNQQREQRDRKKADDINKSKPAPERFPVYTPPKSAVPQKTTESASASTTPNKSDLIAQAIDRLRNPTTNISGKSLNREQLAALRLSASQAANLTDVSTLDSAYSMGELKQAGIKKEPDVWQNIENKVASWQKRDASVSVPEINRQPTAKPESPNQKNNVAKKPPQKGKDFERG